MSLSSDPEIFRRLDEVTKLYGQTNEKLIELSKVLDSRRLDLEGAIKEKSEALRWSSFQPQYLRDFIEEPYVIEPYRIGKAGKVLEWRVYVPKFVRFAAGRLERVTSSYNVFSITQYHRFFGDIPEELKERFPELPYDVKVKDGLLIVPPEFESEAWDRFKAHLQGRTGMPGMIKIRPKDEWSLIAQIIEEGRLPFEPKPVDPADIRPRSVKGFALQEGWEERDYQLDADRLFMEYGAIGIYWPFGTGKSQYAVDWLDRLKGHKIIIAGRDSTLREQWEERLKKMTPERRAECHIFILQNRDKIEDCVKKVKKDGKQISLVVYDECLPYESMVSTENGPMPIGEIVENRLPVRVWSYNYSTKSLELNPVTNWSKKTSESIMEIETCSGEKLKLTPTHKVYNDIDNHLPTEAGNLNVGNELVHLSDLRKNIREVAIPRWSHYAPQTPRTQPECQQRTPLEQREPNSVSGSPDQVFGREAKKRQSKLERRKSPPNMEADSLSGLGTTEGMRVLSRTVGGVETGHSSQGREPLQQYERESIGDVSKLPHESAPGGWGKHLEMDSITKITRVEGHPTTVYDIEVRNAHTFFAENILVSNCHHLPALTFMWMSTIDAKYRIGLTGSPYREDGHIEYIMALTGMPHGFSWTKFVTSGVISLAQVQIHVVKEFKQKLAILDDLLKHDLGKTMIFCDSLDLGDKIAKKYGLQWIHGETKNRLELIRRNERVVVSRVADEGISINDLDTLIEIDFMGGSRAQEMQRAGRLSHRAITPDQEPAVHHILMTEDEVDQYGKRLLAFYDKGFKVEMMRRS